MLSYLQLLLLLLLDEILSIQFHYEKQQVCFWFDLNLLSLVLQLHMVCQLYLKNVVKHHQQKLMNLLHSTLVLLI